ncbi:hypothetical protein IGI04_026600 [Brassica rapa subsp. trilocularis]|uniref:Tubulin/FtsZ GTPase domain-containing protein n=1 Tax=Brassica rapa subsp. trilocularis TaxID=1813537 RepID=A0ABQ7KWI6_BRACM|nr:hypothetical protein IGI04_026600 [Brassica rapa subsp. trilocularis]
MLLHRSSPVPILGGQKRPGAAANAWELICFCLIPRYVMFLRCSLFCSSKTRLVFFTVPAAFYSALSSMPKIFDPYSSYIGDGRWRTDVLHFSKCFFFEKNHLTNLSLAFNCCLRFEVKGVSKLFIRTLSAAKAPAALPPSRYVFCIFKSWVFCKYSSTQQHHKLRCNLKTSLMLKPYFGIFFRFIGTSARNMENLDSTPRLKASFNLDTTVDALKTFVCETGAGKHVPRALFIDLEPTVAVMVHLTNLEHINENHMH